MSHPSIEARLESRAVQISSGCIEFTGGKSGNGYGTIYYQGRQVYAHRVVWELNKGKIENGKCVLHICDNPSCINIQHLFLGTHKDNTQDMMAKDRQNFYKKLTVPQVKTIKARLCEGHKTSRRALYLELAQMFDVSLTTIRRIDTQEHWSHI